MSQLARHHSGPQAALPEHDSKGSGLWPTGSGEDELQLAMATCQPVTDELRMQRQEGTQWGGDQD